MESKEQLYNFISIFYRLNDREWDAFSGIWQPYECKRKTVLMAEYNPGNSNSYR